MVEDVTCPYCKSQAFKYLDSDTEMLLCHGCKRNISWNRVEKYEFSNSRMSNGSDSTVITVRINNSGVLSHCKRLSDLEDSHRCVSFVRNRNIPSSFYNDLYFTENLGNMVSPYGYEFRNGQPKLIIPFRDEDGEIFGLQARSLDDAQPKYLTVLFDKEKEKIFGLDRWNKEETTVVVEGPIDSFFLKNSLAVAGADIAQNKYLEPNKDIVICLDNEPRNAVIVSKYDKVIKFDYQIVVWPDYVKEKDINDMILAGLDPQKIIEENTFRGMKAQIKLNAWKKI